VGGTLCTTVPLLEAFFARLAEMPDHEEPKAQLCQVVNVEKELKAAGF
jgi:hypothetical protein